jgi:hypothetical protein
MPKKKTGLPPGLAKREELPPGLEMQVEKNGSLPPGLAKRLPDGAADIDAFVVNKFGANQVLLNQGGAQGGEPGDFSLGIPPERDARFAYNVALGDVDGDGDLDAFVSNTDLNEVLINQGGAQGGIPGELKLGIPPEGIFQTSRDVALGDLDGDGDLDAFIANDPLANQVLINQGGAQGGTPGDFDLGTPPEGGDGLNPSFAVALGDVDGDGDLDAFVANRSGFPDQPNQLLINDGTGVLTLSANQPEGGALISEDVALGDVDGDGDLDAFVANIGDAGVGTVGPDQVLINQGGAQGGSPGDFDLGIAPEGGDFQASSAVALGDLDGDGDLDAFIANSSALQPNLVLINQGEAQGGIAGDFDLGIEPEGGNQVSEDVALADLDGDGDLDAFITNSSTSDPNLVLINQGGAQGGVPGDFDLGTEPEGGNLFSLAVALGDLDGDGGVPPVDESGLPNIDQDGLLPSMYVDTIV